MTLYNDDVFIRSEQKTVHKSLLLPLEIAGATETATDETLNTRCEICVTFAGKITTWLLRSLSWLRNAIYIEKK